MYRQNAQLIAWANGLNTPRVTSRAELERSSKHLKFQSMLLSVAWNALRVTWLSLKTPATNTHALSIAEDSGRLGDLARTVVAQTDSASVLLL